MQKRRSGNVFGALILIGLGIWFLAQNLNLPLPSLGVIWPIFLVLGGLLALGSYVTGQDRDPGQVFVGVVGLWAGVFLFLFTLEMRLPLPGLREGVEWSDMRYLWPAFPLIGGVAFIAHFLADPKHDWGEFVVGVLALTVGAVAFPFTLGLWPGDLGRTLLKLWPVLLIVAGLAGLLQALFRRRGP